MVPVLDGRTWLGAGSFHATSFTVELFESRKRPGSYHYATYCGDDSFHDETRLPMKAAFVPSMVDMILTQHGLVTADLKWREVPGSELPLMGGRFLAGE